MSEKSASSGSAVWHEIVTDELQKAIDFYTGLFGWTIDEADSGPGGKYTMFKTGEKHIGGILTEKTAGVPAHWITYFAVEDVDTAVETAAGKGGQVLVPGTDIPEIGRFACIRDAQGGVTCPYKSLQDMPAPDPGQAPPCDFVWEELMSSDPESAVAFYRQLYGWDHEKTDMGEIGAYHIMKSGDLMVAGIMKIPAEAAGAPTHWIPYIGVDDVDAYAQKAAGLGAKVYVPPRDIPNTGRFATLADTLGASFAIFKAAREQA